MKAICKKASGVLIAVQRALCNILMVLCPTLLVLQIVTRALFNVTFVWLEEFMGFLLIWLYMLGGANTSQTRSHIECGILSLYLKSEKATRIANLVKSVICFAVSCWATKWSLWYANYSIHSGRESGILKIPKYMGEAAVAVGIILMTVYCLADLIIDIQKMLELRGGSADAENTAAEGGKE